MSDREVKVTVEMVEVACETMWPEWYDWSSMRKHKARREMRDAIEAALDARPGRESTP